MGRVLKFLKPYKKRIVLIFIVALLLSVLSFANAWLFGSLSNALFYRTKGLPLSLSLTVNQKNSNDVQLGLVKTSDWNQIQVNELNQKLTAKGLKVVSEKISKNLVQAQVKPKASQIQDPLIFIGDIKQDLKSSFNTIEAYIAPLPTKPVQQFLIFPQFYTVFIIPFILVLVYSITGILRYAQTYAIGSMGQKIVMNLRNAIYENLQNLSLSYFEKNKTGQTGQIISRILGDIESINFLFASGFFDMLLKPMVVIFGLVWGFMINWQLTLVFFIAFPLIGLPISYLSKKLRLVSVESMNQMAEVTGVLEETFGAIKVVKAFGMEKYEVDRFKRETRHSYKASMRCLRIGTVFLPTIEFMISIGLGIFLTVGGSLVIHYKLSPGEFFTFAMLVTTMAGPIRDLSGIVGNIPRALAGAERVFELVDQRSDIVEAENPIDLPAIHGKVQFEQVSFGYSPDQLVLNDINLIAQPGEIVAFVGPSGAGKSTMINLVARFYDPLSGVIRIDDVDMRELKMDTFRKQLGIVPQETILFRGTIADNIAYGKPDATEAEIIAAARAANVEEFISQMPDGYQTKVGSRGATLSGGQRQRVAIARALLRDPRILILDEATSALDTQSEVLVQEALQRLMKNRTCFVIAHRLSTIRNADRIVTMNEGRIVEAGTHQELLDQNGLYAKLYHTQFRKDNEQ